MRTQCICLLILVIGQMGCGSSRDLKTADSNAGSNAAAAGLGVLVYRLVTDDKRAVEKAAGSAAAAATVTMVKEGSKASREEGEWERVIGPENTNGLVALIKRDYRSAKDAFAKTAHSENPEYRRAAIWGTALMYYDTGNDEALEPELAKVVETDAAVANDREARKELGRLNKKLADLRKKYR